MREIQQERDITSSHEPASPRKEKFTRPLAREKLTACIQRTTMHMYQITGICIVQEKCRPQLPWVMALSYLTLAPRYGGERQ